MTDVAKEEENRTNPTQPSSSSSSSSLATQDSGGVSLEKIGTILAGRYEIKGVLGSGAFSDIYQVTDRFGGGASFALKIARVSQYNFVVLQESETLRTLAKQDHFGAHHFVKVFATFLHDDRFCLVLENLGPSLQHVIQTSLFVSHALNLYEGREITKSGENKPIAKKEISTSLKDRFIRPSITQLREIAYQLLTALVYFEKEKVIHADLKPENILLTSDPKDRGVWGMLQTVSIKIIDFGNAFHIFQANLYPDFELQTMAFRAPEVFFGHSITYKIDVWSVGCVLLSLLCSSPSIFSPPKNEKEKTSSRALLLNCWLKVLGPVPHRPFETGIFSQGIKQALPHVFQNEKGSEQMHLEKFLSSFDIELRPPLVIDFLSNLLQYDPGKRFSASQALCHPFIAPSLPPIFSASLAKVMAASNSFTLPTPTVPIKETDLGGSLPKRNAQKSVQSCFRNLDDLLEATLKNVLGEHPELLKEPPHRGASSTSEDSQTTQDRVQEKKGKEEAVPDQGIHSREDSEEELEEESGPNFYFELKPTVQVKSKVVKKEKNSVLESPQNRKRKREDPETKSRRIPPDRAAKKEEIDRYS